jgi:hypothetical protein
MTHRRKERRRREIYIDLREYVKAADPKELMGQVNRH